jgi:hypothetical protein
MKKPKKLRLKIGYPVEIVWTDACGGRGWQEAFEEGVEVISVGNLVVQNKRGVGIATGIVNEDKEKVLLPSFIPKSCIKKMRRLR